MKVDLERFFIPFSFSPYAHIPCCDGCSVAHHEEKPFVSCCAKEFRPKGAQTFALDRTYGIYKSGWLKAECFTLPHVNFVLFSRRGCDYRFQIEVVSHSVLTCPELLPRVPPYLTHTTSAGLGLECESELMSHSQNNPNTRCFPELAQSSVLIHIHHLLLVCS